MLDFSKPENIENLKSLLSGLSLISTARFNYNLELHRFFSDPSKKSEIADFWKTVCPFAVNPALAKCFDDFHRVTKSKVSVYLNIQRALNEDLSQYDDVRLLDLYFHMKFVRNNTISQEEDVVKLYESGLKKSQQKGSIKKRWASKFREISLESSSLRKMTELLEDYFAKAAPIYGDFINQVIVGESLPYVSNYKPSMFYLKVSKRLDKISKRVQRAVAENGSVEAGLIMIQRCLDLHAAFRAELDLVGRHVNSSKTLENTRWRFEHFKKLYLLSESANLIEFDFNYFFGAKPLQLETVILDAPIESLTLPPPEPEAESQQGHEPIESDTLPLESEMLCTSSSSSSCSASIEPVLHALQELSLDTETSEAVEAPYVAYSPHWEKSKQSRAQSTESIPSSSATSYLTSLADRLSRTGCDEVLRQLFSGSIHKKFSFQQLVDLIKTCGGKVENISGSVRRIILGKFASDTLEMTTDEVVKLNVHAPHGKHTVKEPLPSCIAKHFQCVLMQAGITPKTVFGEEIEALRTPVMSSSSTPTNDSKVSSAKKETFSKQKRRWRR